MERICEKEMGDNEGREGERKYVYDPFFLLDLLLGKPSFLSLSLSLKSLFEIAPLCLYI